jgi:hypothetical protein
MRSLQHLLVGATSRFCLPEAAVLLREVRMRPTSVSDGVW